MGWVKTGLVERDMLIAQRLKDFTINTGGCGRVYNMVCGIRPVRLMITGKMVGGG